MVESSGKENLLAEGPMNTVIYLFEIQLKDPYLLIFSMELMEYLMKDQNAIEDEPPLDEGRLGRAD